MLGNQGRERGNKHIFKGGLIKIKTNQYQQDAKLGLVLNLCWFDHRQILATFEHLGMKRQGSTSNVNYLSDFRWFINETNKVQVDLSIYMIRYVLLQTAMLPRVPRCLSNVTG